MDPQLRALRLIGPWAALVVGMLAARSAVAGPNTWYVDGDAETCPGSGTDSLPFCTLQDAFDGVVPEPGDRVWIRDATEPYGAATADGTWSGTNGAPIVVEPEPGSSPVFAGSVALRNLEYVTLRGLVLDPGATPIAGAMISVEASSGSEGVVVELNTVVSAPADPATNGFSGINVYSATDAMPRVTIRRNVVQRARGGGISVDGATEAIVEDNLVRDIRCKGEDSDRHSYGVIVRDVTSGRVSGNDIARIGTEACELSFGRVAGILGYGARGMTFERNLVRSVGRAGTQDGEGIDLVNGSSSNTVMHNVIVDTAFSGIAIGRAASGGGNADRILSNTVVGAGVFGMYLDSGVDHEVFNNLVASSGQAHMDLGPGIAVTIDHNMYSGNVNSTIGVDDGTAVDLAGWQALGYDANAQVGDPRLPSEDPASVDYTPGSGSPSIDNGTPIAGLVADDGTGVDIGAFDPPVALAARVDANRPAAIDLELTLPNYGPLGVDPGCLGFAVARDEVQSYPSSCIKLSETSVRVKLDSPVYVGQAVMLRFSGVGLTDGAGVGSTIDAQVQPFELAVDNGSNELPPTPAGTGTSSGSGGEPGTSGGSESTTTTQGSGPGGSGTTGTGAVEPEPPCVCSARRSSPTFESLALFALFGLARRRR